MDEKRRFELALRDAETESLETLEAGARIWDELFGETSDDEGDEDQDE
ncbi:MAG: hypothetical protein GTO24_21065 [candidate division Zixibacteria bacterium]|nr:hypothetical protein [candidate division Zixibacteria bacterium]